MKFLIERIVNRQDEILDNEDELQFNGNIGGITKFLETDLKSLHPSVREDAEYNVYTQKGNFIAQFMEDRGKLELLEETSVALMITDALITKNRVWGLTSLSDSKMAFNGKMVITTFEFGFDKRKVAKDFGKEPLTEENAKKLLNIALRESMPTEFISALASTTVEVDNEYGYIQASLVFKF